MAIMLCLGALTTTSCDFVKNLSMEPATELVGSKEGELKEKVQSIFEYFDTNAEKAEIAEISTSFSEKSKNADVTVKMITPDDKNKMAEYRWENTEAHKGFAQDELIVSTSIGNDIVDNYEGLKDMLFKYADVTTYIENLPTYCMEALEAAGYKDDGYVSIFKISRNGSDEIEAYITVKHKKTGMVSKSFEISQDGKHIVKK